MTDLQPGDLVHYHGSPADFGTVCDDDGSLVVAWHDGGEINPIDPAGLILDLPEAPGPVVFVSRPKSWPDAWNRGRLDTAIRAYKRQCEASHA